MTQKEKAIELMQKYYETTIAGTEEKVQKFLVKQQSIIAVDEVIKVCPYYSKDNLCTLDEIRASDYEFVSYWEEVKQEIEKL